MKSTLVAAGDPVVTEVDPVVAAADPVVSEELSAVSDGDFVASDVDSDTSTSAEFTQPDPLPKTFAVAVKAPSYRWQPTWWEGSAASPFGVRLGAPCSTKCPPPISW